MRDMTSICRQLAAATLLFTLTSLNAPKALANSGFTDITPTNASSLLSGSPVTITWQGGESSWTVNVSLIDVDAWAVARTVTSNMPNSAPSPSVDWRFPSSLRCNRNYRFSVAEVSNIAWAYGPIFKLTCDPSSPQDWFAQGGAGFTLVTPERNASPSSGSPVTIIWQGGSPAWTVNVSLIDVDAWAVARTVTSNISNNPPSVDWTFPSSLPCGRRYEFSVAEDSNITWTYGPIFKLTCDVNVANDWDAQALPHRSQIGTRFVYGCPPRGPQTALRVYGTDIYTDDSAVCQAAVHMGLITSANGGTVAIVIKAGQDMYFGSTRFGYISKDWTTGWDGSFSFVP